MSGSNQEPVVEPIRCWSIRPESLRAGIMLFVSFTHLVVAAVLVHPANGRGMPEPARDVLRVALALLSLVCVVDAILGVVRRDRTKPRRPVLLRAVLACLVPPTRIVQSDSRTGLIWLPGLGWNEPGDDLHRRVEKFFALPMLLCGVLILPLLLAELAVRELAAGMPGVAIALSVGIAAVWIVITTDLVVSCHVHPKSPITVLKSRVPDVTFVVLPVVAFALANWSAAVQLAVWLRIFPAVAPERLDAKQQYSQIQVLLTRLWAALVLVGWFARLLGQTPERRLEKIPEEIAEREERIANELKQIDELRKEAELCREQIAGRAAMKH
jgi:hypothetical protein